MLYRFTWIRWTPPAGPLRVGVGLYTRTVWAQTPGKDTSGDYSYRDFVRDIHARLHEQHRRRITIEDIEAVGRPDAA